MSFLEPLSKEQALEYIKILQKTDMVKTVSI